MVFPLFPWIKTYRTDMKFWQKFATMFLQQACPALAPEASALGHVSRFAGTVGGTF